MRKFGKLLLGAATLTLVGASAHAALITPVTPPPGAVSTMVFGLNDNLVIVGAYLDANKVEHGFFGPLNGTYTKFDFGGTSTGTAPRSIANSGFIVGYAFDPAYVVGEEFSRAVDGTLKPITKNGVPLDGIAQGLKLNGAVSVGDYRDPTGRLGYVANNGVYQHDLNLNVNALRTSPRGINKDGTTAGFFVDANSIQHGFIFKNGIVQVIDADNSGTTVLEGLNNHEFTAGQVVDALGNQHAFTYNN